MNESPMRALVAKLCDPRRVRVLREPATAELWAADEAALAALAERATSRWATLPPLLAQLEQAVASNVTVKERGGAGGGSPVDWDAVDLLDRLRVTVADWTGHARLRPRPELASGLRQLGVHAWTPLDEAMLCRVLARLVHRAEQHLTPDDVAPVRYVRLDCPACGYRMLTTRSADGETVTGFALVVEFHRGFVNSMTCQVCWAYWTRHHLSELAIRTLTPNALPV